VLRQIGVTLAKVQGPGNCQQRFVEAYRCYLLQERGLAVATVAYFVRFAEEFLSDRFGNGDLNLSELCGQDVTGFVQSRADRLSPRTCEVAGDRSSLSLALHATPGRDFY
jgi:hypothetical protein